MKLRKFSTTFEKPICINNCGSKLIIDDSLKRNKKLKNLNCSGDRERWSKKILQPKCYFYQDHWHNCARVNSWKSITKLVIIKYINSIDLIWINFGWIVVNVLVILIFWVDPVGAVNHANTESTSFLVHCRLVNFNYVQWFVLL